MSRNFTSTYALDLSAETALVTNPAALLDRLSSITDPLLGTTSFNYDLNDNLKTLTNAQGNITTWNYDTLNRATSDVNQLNKSRIFEFDSNGNVSKVIDRRVHEVYLGEGHG